MASVLAPSDCRACGGPLLAARSFAVCDTCVDRLRPERTALCDRCGERLDMDDLAGAGFSRQKPAVCELCSTDPPPFVRATAFAAYDGVLRTLIRLHKFEGMQELAAPLGERLAPVVERVASADPHARWHVVAVPLFARRRRYNQSAQIADAAVRRLTRMSGVTPLLRSHQALRRTRPTESQSQLTPAQRRANVRGAFAVTGDVTGWNVILVDDVYTTGATARECSQTLMAAGASAVHVVTVARTQPDRIGRWNPSAHAGNVSAGVADAWQGVARE